MKKLKIFISLILVLTLLPIFPAFAADEAEEYTEPTATEAFKKLEAFGIMTADDEILYYDYVTRAQFMQYVMKCYFGDGAYSKDLTEGSVFGDVTEGTTGAAEITAACKLGIISSGASFRPDDNITMQEAAKILVSALGYSEIAANRGGYPTGYLKVASEQDIFDDCSFTQEGYLPVADFVQALANTLEAQVMEISAIWDTRRGLVTTYTAVYDKTLLEYAFGIYRAEGIVEANEYTSIYGLTELQEGRVEIGGTVYKTNGTDAAQLLGYNTECFYKLDKPEANREIVYIAAYDNEIIIVDSEDIAKDAVTATNFAYYREDKDKVQNEAIKKSATLIYNGGQMSLTAANLCPANGTVTLINNDGDKDIDVVSVMNYRTILVSAVSPSSYTVSDMLGGESIVLDPEESDSYDVVIELNGVEADFASISDRSIISYAESIGNVKNIKYVKVSTMTVEGMPEAIGEDTVVISGEEYSIDTNLVQTLSLRDTGVFYMDYSGKIVAKKVEKDVVYGYLNGVITESSISGKVKAQIFTENDRWVELELKDKITYNGTGSEKPEKFFNDWQNGRVGRELITYTVDSDGKINMIKQAESFEAFSDAEENAIEQDIFRVYDEISSEKYRSNLKSIGSTVLLSDATKIFMVPDQTTETASLEDFHVVSTAGLFTEVSYKNITPYDLDRSRTAGAIVMVGNDEVIDDDALYMLVDSVVRSFNADDKAVDAVKGYYKNSLITLPAADDSVYSGLSEKLAGGDIIQFTMDAQGNISKLNLIYDAEKGLTTTTSYGYKETASFAGTVHYTDAQKSKLVVDLAGQKCVMGTKSATVISVYDTETEKLTPGTIADLEKGNKFVARVTYLIADEIIVYH
ncbi:MAG: hypothetical protein IJ365_04715 [Clostridia bacterium]|nr:hypothetical protein [Clostridia bacterium]